MAASGHGAAQARVATLKNPQKIRGFFNLLNSWFWVYFGPAQDHYIVKGSYSLICKCQLAQNQNSVLT
jgi:hypothetical protein